MDSPGTRARGGEQERRGGDNERKIRGQEDETRRGGEE